MTFKLITSVALLVVLGASAIMAQDEAGPQKLVKLAHASDDFGLLLLHRLELAEKQTRGSGAPKNLLVSPFSVHTVMSMLMAGAANQTYSEIYKSLG